MRHPSDEPTPRRIGFISTRLGGTDGVSLEAKKWAACLEECEHECFFLAGQCDHPAERSMVVPTAHFDHPRVRELQADFFNDYHRAPATSEAVHRLRAELKGELNRFVERFRLSLLIVENALSLPMHVPLGLALTELIAETTLPVIAHHHDFTWERERFQINAVQDYLAAAFPPRLPAIHHVTINTHAATELAWRTGMRSTVVPNVMHFEQPPAPPDAYSADLRSELGVRPDEALLLQPTRVVPRKRIERAIELASRLDRPAALVVSHEAGDEGLEYARYIRQHAERSGVKLILAADRFDLHRGQTPDGRKIYALADAYQRADLVTYPSRVEGFGNAFLEAIYYRCPIVMSAYDIFKTDIRPKGFNVVTFDDFISERTLREVQTILEDGDWVHQMTEHNFRLGAEHYSFYRLRTRLSELIAQSVAGRY